MKNQSQFNNPNRDTVWIVWRESTDERHSPTWIIDAIMYTREQCEQYYNTMGRTKKMYYQEWELDADRPEGWMK